MEDKIAALAKNTSPEQAAESLPALPVVENGSFFDIDSDAKPVKGPKNILLLTLSTMNYKKSTIRLSDDPDAKPIDYYYQLEPVPYMLMHEFADAGSDDPMHLDGLIMICSPQTRTKKETCGSPELGQDSFSDTAENFLKYKVSNFAKQYGYCPSFKSIHTEIGGPGETAEDRSQNTVKLVHDVVEEIRLLKKHYPGLTVHVDTHGGFRTTQEILNSILSLLQMEGIPIDPKNIHSVEFNNGSAYFSSSSEVFNIMNFVSGIHECINYGQTKSLDMFFGEKGNGNDSESNVLKQMKMIAEGIQLCDVVKFEEGLDNLSTALSALTPTEHTTGTTGYLSMFQYLIRDSYGEKLLASPRQTIDEIKWCVEKGFIQQALTLMESKMPADIIKNNFLFCPALFKKTTSGTVIISSEREHLEEENSPRFSWESAENYIFNKFGETKSISKGNFLDLDEVSQKAPGYFRGRRYLNLRNRSDPSWENRSYEISEHQKAKAEINFLVRLHMQLKQERNTTNHAVENQNRHSVETIIRALNIYIATYEAILKKVPH